MRFLGCWSLEWPRRIRVVTSSLDSIYPSFPEVRLATHSWLCARKPGSCLELCRDNKGKDVEGKIFHINIQIEKKKDFHTFFHC